LLNDTDFCSGARLEKLSEEITHLLSPVDKLAVNAYIIGVLIPVLVDGIAVAMI